MCIYVHTIINSCVRRYLLYTKLYVYTSMLFNYQSIFAFPRTRRVHRAIQVQQTSWGSEPQVGRSALVGRGWFRIPYLAMHTYLVLVVVRTRMYVRFGERREWSGWAGRVFGFCMQWWLVHLVTFTCCGVDKSFFEGNANGRMNSQLNSEEALYTLGGWLTLVLPMLPSKTRLLTAVPARLDLRNI